MKKEQADVEAQKIIEECIKERNEIIEKAKEQGKWGIGLDHNQGLLKENHDKYFKKLQDLAKQIDE